MAKLTKAEVRKRVMAVFQLRIAAQSGPTSENMRTRQSRVGG